MGRLAGCNRRVSRVYLDPGCSDFSDYLLDCRGRISDFVFRVDVRGLVWVAPKAALNGKNEILQPSKNQVLGAIPQLRAISNAYRHLIA